MKGFASGYNRFSRNGTEFGQPLVDDGAVDQVRMFLLNLFYPLGEIFIMKSSVHPRNLHNKVPFIYSMTKFQYFN